jgi:hypothetical protein
MFIWQRSSRQTTVLSSQKERPVSGPPAAKMLPEKIIPLLVSTNIVHSKILVAFYYKVVYLLWHEKFISFLLNLRILL